MIRILMTTLVVLACAGAATAQTIDIIETVAGNGVAGFGGDGGPATSASLNFPGLVALDAAGNLFLSDERNQRVRR